MNNALLLLQRLNNGLAVMAGGLLLVSVLVTIVDIVLRQTGNSLGGTDELSGYAMAIATSWGMSYTLTNLAHVRIDLVRARCNPPLRSLFDAIALLSLAGTAIVIAYRVWPVLEKSIENSSTANTTLETPLWIPQSMWMAGWLWFAVSAVLMTLVLIISAFQSDYEAINRTAGLGDDV
ncbi:MAG: TRAP-type C4-dicarboxylate transport system permease small subunit [Porticoccaceae bacterium]|jgi:TRAP-type C4-dicarboxylate transport system permease small subunit